MNDIFIHGTEPKEYCDYHNHPQYDPLRIYTSGNNFRITFPSDGDIFKIDPVLRGEHQRLKLNAIIPEGINIDRVEWHVNSRNIGETDPPFSLFWNLTPGFYTIKANAKSGTSVVRSDSVRIQVLS